MNRAAPTPRPAIPKVLSVRTDVSERGVLVLRLGADGPVSVEVAESRLEALAPILDAPGARLALDLSGVEFIGSDGIETLFRARERAAHVGSGLAVFGANGVVRDVLCLAGLDILVGVFPDEEGALRFLDGTQGPGCTWH